MSRSERAAAPAARELLERDREQRALDEAVADAAAGRGRLVLMRGPAGAGKTALLDTACLTAEQRGVRVLRARAAEFERDLSFGTVRQLLQPVVDGASRAERTRIFAGAAGLARPLFGGHSFPRDDREDRAASFVEGLAWVVANVVRERAGGALLAVDDVHACDRASLRTLARIALRLDQLGVLLILAFRPGDPDSERDLIGWLVADPDALVLEPAPLSAAAVARMIEGELGRPPAPAFAASCHRSTGGNPFLTRELAAALSAERIEPDEPHSDVVRQMVPGAVVRSVGARIARLGEHARLVAEAVAILGADAVPSRVAELAGLAATDVAPAADDLVAAGLLADGMPLRFAHPLFASAVERDVGPSAARLAHARAAGLLAADDQPAERIAAHLVLSPPAGDPWAVTVLRSAAADLVRTGGARGAVPLLRRALDEPPSPGERTDLLRELAFAEAAAGEPTATGHLLELLNVVESPAERVRGLRELARLQFLNEHHHDAARTIKQAMTEIGKDDPHAPELVAEFLAYAGVGSSTLDAALRQDAESTVRDLLAQAERGTLPDDPALRIHVANAVGAGRGRRRDVRHMIERVVAQARLDQLPPYGIAASWAVLALACVDELELADEITSAWEVTAQHSGSMHGRGLAAFSRAVISVESGAFDRAVADADTALDLACSGVPTTIVWAAALLTDAHRTRGDLVAAQRSIAVAERAQPDDIAYGIGIAARADLHRALGRPARAWQDALQAAAALDQYLLRDYPLFPWRLAAARAGRHLDRVSQAAEYAEEELALSRRSEVPRSIGRALVACAELTDDGARQLELLDEAVAVLAGSHARLARAEALHALGAARRRHGFAVAAKEPLLGALDLAERCGAPPLADAVRRDLRRLGVSPPAPCPSGRRPISPAERRVAELAAAGRTNRQIAADLHLATSTVEYHLTRAFRKLGVNSRSELSAALSALGE